MSGAPDTRAPLRGVSYLYMAAAFVVVISGVRAAAVIINPLLLAVFLSIISAPAYFALLRKGVANWLALGTVIGVLSILVASVVFVVTGSINGFLSRYDDYQELLHERTKSIQRQAEQWLPHWNEEAENNQNAEEQPAEPESGERSADGADMAADADVPAPAKAEQTSSGNDSTADASAERADEDIVRDGAGEAVAPADVPGSAGDANSAAEFPETEAQPDAETGKNAVLPETGARTGPSHGNSTVAETSIAQPTTPSGTDSESAWKDFVSEQFSPGVLIALARQVLESVGNLLSNALLILLTVIFILLEAGSLPRKLSEAFPEADHAADRGREIVASVLHYMVIKAVLSLITGLLLGIWLSFLGVPYAGLWGLLAFLFNFIPNIGSIIAAIPPVLITWLEMSTGPAVAVAIGYLAVNVVIGNFIEPRVMGRGLNLSPLVVFFSMVFWGWVLGPIGMLLSVPLTMTVRIAIVGFPDLKWLATLMGSAD